MSYTRLDDLYSLHNRLVDDYNDDKPFEQTEEDRLLTYDLIEKIESGQLVELKYKEGDYVFFISWLSGNVCEGTVVGWQEDGGYCINCGDDMISAYECFSTEAEAVARLEALEQWE